MAEFTVVVSDGAAKGIEAKAKADGITPEELIQRQIDYYVNCIIGDYIDYAMTVEFKPAEVEEVKRRIAGASVAIVLAYKEELEPKVP
jgi:hypothetical protein